LIPEILFENLTHEENCISKRNVDRYSLELTFVTCQTS